jgi:hypothetical protein
MREPRPLLATSLFQLELTLYGRGAPIDDGDSLPRFKNEDLNHFAKDFDQTAADGHSRNLSPLLPCSVRSRGFLGASGYCSFGIGAGNYLITHPAAYRVAATISHDSGASQSHTKTFACEMSRSAGTMMLGSIPFKEAAVTLHAPSADGVCASAYGA